MRAISKDLRSGAWAEMNDEKKRLMIMTMIDDNEFTNHNEFLMG